MSVPGHIVKDLAATKEKAALKIYLEDIKARTAELLSNPSLTTKKLIEIVHVNQDNRLSIIKRVQRYVLDNIFKAHPDDFHTTKFHYDWWAFPMTVPSEWNWPFRNYDASLAFDEATVLLFDDEFVQTYLSCINLYIDALEKNGWNNYPIRYARMLASLTLFLTVAHQIESLSELAYEGLSKAGIRATQYAKKAIHYPLIDHVPSLRPYNLLELHSNDSLLINSWDSLQKAVNQLTQLETREELRPR